MEAVVLQKPNKFTRARLSEPGEPGPGEALVRVRRIGICGTDLHAYRGNQPFFTYPRILGHELGVEVIVAPFESGFKPGDLCAVEPYLNCGHCFACLAGKTNCCENLSVLGVHVDGGMRQSIMLPASKLHLSKKLTLDQLALVETLGIGAHAVSRAEVKPGDWVLVIGAGPIGLAVMQFVNIAKCRLIAMDCNADRLGFCCRQMRVEASISSEEKTAEVLKEITAGELPSVVFDATGNPLSMTKAFGYVSHGGKLVFVGLVKAEITFSDPDFHRRELSLLSSRNSTAIDFKRIIHLIEEGQIDTGPWITHRANFEDLIEKFPTWLDPQNRVVKAMVEV